MAGKVLLTDTEFAPTTAAALAAWTSRLVIDIADSEGPGSDRLGAMDYEAFIAGRPRLPRGRPKMSGRYRPNYTSGDRIKGVVYHHRSAY